MKKIIYTLLFLLFSSFVFHANSQSVILSAVTLDKQEVKLVKALKGIYYNDKVYLHIILNNNTENKFVAIERSPDAIHFKVIGYIKIFGTTDKVNLAYYFTDESPLAANLFYRISDYSFGNEPVYSETISIIPINENKTPSGIITTTPVYNEPTNTLSGKAN